MSAVFSPHLPSFPSLPKGLFIYFSIIPFINTV